jgi:hypothetical protein
MTQRVVDTSAWTQALHETFAPVQRAQQEGLKALERLTKFQYSVASDYLQTGLAQAQAAFSSRTPSEFLSKQAELGTHFGACVSARVHELAAFASETQRGFTQVRSEAARPAAVEDPQTAAASGARGRRRRERRARRDERRPE